MQSEQQFIDGKIVRGEAPLNLEMPFETLDGFITPTKSFYVRTHFPIPKIDKNKWRLRIEGEVEKPFEIDYHELTKLAWKKVPVTLECADRGKLEDPKSPAGDLNFARSIPLEKANDVLLAYKMNDVDLPPEHGFPLRAIVPGWYAMASIKWLQRIIVTDRPFNGYYQTLDYAFWKRRGDNAELVPLSEMQIKAEIAQPSEGETVPANSNVRVHGAAWTSNGEIKKVEISSDDGATWNEAKLIGESKPDAWRLWECSWKTPARSGKATLIARATDSNGRTQPTERDPDRGTYMINHLLPITVEVK